MNKNWIGMTTEMSGAVREVRSGAPDVMKAFSALAQAALRPESSIPRPKS